MKSNGLDLKSLLKNNIDIVIPTMHFLLTFVWERTLFLFSRNNWNLSVSVARKESISDSTELVLVYILSKLVAGLIIWLFWKLIFSIVKGEIVTKKAVLFGTIYLIGLIVGIFSFPSTFALEIDNYTNYSYAIRFLPTYWQSIYTGAVYAGCMMVIPHPFSIFAFQWMSFVAVIAYIYSGIESVLQDEKRKYIALIFLVFPESYFIMFNAYRNNFYTILCLFYFAYIFFSARREKEYSLKKMICITALSAFIMVWRSEGILIGVGGMLFLVLFVYKIQWKRVVLLGLVFIFGFVALNNIQGIGSQKYYGKDYMIINTTNVLYSIFNDPEANLSYSGADEDLANIESVIPVEVLKESAMTGYRNYNWTAGRKDCNQTLVDDVTAKKYMSSYYRLIYYNITDYLNVQVNCFFNALQINAKHTTYSYTGDSQIELEQFVYDSWQIGKKELNETFLTEEWENNKVRIFIYSVFSWILLVWRELWGNTGINVILHSGAIMADILILIIQIIKYFSDKQRIHLEFILLFLILIGELFAVLLFMPEGRAAYLYPMLYTSYLLIYIYVVCHTGKCSC